MQQTSKPVSKSKVALLWLLLIGNLGFWCWFWGWRQAGNSDVATEGPGDHFVRLVAVFIIGGMFLAAGLASYALVILTNCFTFNFRRPFFKGFKGKLYLAKIIIPILISVGAGLMLAVLLEPVLRAFGVHGQMSFMLPLFIVLVPFQIAQMWVNLWQPLTKRMLGRRLAARGIQPEQLQNATLVGISDPRRSSFKKWTLVEDDVGALWLTDAHLIYWGDTEQFALTREQILQLERRADAGSTSMLSGTTHVILHAQFPGGNARQIRFHTSAHWTLGQNRRAMDELSAAITKWHHVASPDGNQPVPAAPSTREQPTPSGKE